MGTRSRIGVMHGDVVKSVYCHWDGYYDHNGHILLEKYNSSKANQLVALGDISSLRNEIDIPDDVEHSFDKANDNITIFYNRDRGEDTSWKVAHSFNEFLGQVEDCCGEYYYIMKDGVWYAGKMYGSDALQLTALDELLTVTKEEEYA
jgi:hypothetical protein